MWGIESEFSTHAARALAASGHRLLLVGSDRQMLEQLDAGLAQSELHRFTQTPALNAVGAWVEEQNAGLDGLVVFVPAPEPQPSVFVPLSANLRSSERSVFTTVELIRELLPQLRRGKRPKRVLLVLDWQSNPHPPMAAVLTHTWQALLPSLTAELNKQGSHFNVLCLRKATSEAADKPIAEASGEPAPPTNPPDAPPANQSRAPAESGVEQEQGSADSTTPTPSEYVQSCVSLLDLYFSPTLPFLNGHFVQHPSPCVNPREASTHRH